MSVRILLALTVVSASAILLLSLSDANTGRRSKDHGSRHCAVGGDAILNVPRAVGGEKLKSKVRVLACHRFRGLGLVQIVGYDTTMHACVAVDYPTEKESEGLECVSIGKRREGMCPAHFACPGAVGWTRTHAEVFTRVNGLAKAAITKAKVTRRKEGKTLSALAFIGHVKGYWLKQLHFPSEFAVFTSSFGGCPPDGHVWVEGFEKKNSAGRVLAPNLIPSACSRQPTAQPNAQAHAVVTIGRAE